MAACIDSGATSMPLLRFFGHSCVTGRISLPHIAFVITQAKINYDLSQSLKLVKQGIFKACNVCGNRKYVSTYCSKLWLIKTFSADLNNWLF